MKKIAIIFFLAMLNNQIQGQSKWELGGYLGYSNYLGDLVEPAFTFDQSTFAGGLHLRYQIMDQIQIRSNLLVGKLKGDDSNYNANLSRAAKFESTYTEMTIIGEYEFFKIDRSGKAFKEKFTPYGYLGLGFGLFNLDFEIGSSTPEAMDDLRHLSSDIKPVLPLGLGAKYALTKSISIGAEWGIRFVFSDYLDGVSMSGNPDKMDVYLSGGVTMSYLFGNNDADHDGIVDRKDLCPDKPGPIKFNGCPDTDGDGLVDAEDECPEDFGKSLLKGCPDSDDDGVPDKFDDCPDDKGIRRFGGCPDTDNDGIVDLEDNCPDEAGIPSLNGCPDADRDGITDAKDECPHEPGTMQLNGCPDRDQDGIADKDDDCPDIKGKLEARGCPDLDTDRDGIIDRNDRCPELAGLLENNGCPKVSQEDQAVLTSAIENVQFEADSDELLPSSFDALNRVADILRKYKGYHLRIHGHTDNAGDDEINLTLSEDRARACYNYFFTQGINPTIISYTGFGGAIPVADNETEEGRAKNRRIEFVLTIDEH